MHPQPRVQSEKAHERSHHRFTGLTRLSPRNGFNGLLRALPGDRAFLPPSFADCSTTLTPASGRQDHTTSPSASSRRSSTTVPRPPHPMPNVRDDRAYAPLAGRDSAEVITDLVWVRSEIFLQRGLDDPNQLEFAREIAVYVTSNSAPGGRTRRADPVNVSHHFARRANQQG
jgi:hypothetical protein